MVLLGLFGMLFARLRTILERAPDIFSRLIVAAVLAWLSTQMIINVGAMIGLLPLKGITLPFVSYGGTSVLFVGAALGLVFQISHYTSFSARNVTRSERSNGEDSSDGRRVRRAYHSDSSSRK
jgi:cell division protein FtsW